jgi:hypothetical protein
MKILLYIFLIFIFLFILFILFIKLLQNKKINNTLINFINPINFINYNDFINIHKIIKKEKIPIYIFYHLCPESNNNINHLIIINDQIHKIIKSGLYIECESIYYGCNCKNCDVFLDNYLKKYTKFIKLENAMCPNIKSYENMTINSMLKFTKKQNKEFYGLYLHTKGTTNKSNTQNSWRNFMMYYLIENYKLCIDIMNRGFYTCGVNYIDCISNPKHYSGNFFWFNSNYLRNLSYINNIYNRLNAESWLFNNYIKNKHISISKERYINHNFYIKIGLYYFDSDYHKNIQNIDIAII